MVIDLGLVHEPEPAAPAPGWRFSPRRTRPVAALACLVLLLGLAGAAPSDGPRLIEIASHEIKARDIVLAGDRLLVTSAAGQGAPTIWELSAYAMPTGEHLWTVPYDAASWRLRQVRRSGDVILVDPRSGPGTGSTVVLDAATGQTRWVAPTGLTLTDDGTAALITESTPGAASPTLRAIEPASGVQLWRAALPASTEVLAGGAGRVLLIGADGRAMLRDGRDGHVVRSVELGAVTRPVAMADTLLLRRWQNGGLGVVAVDPVTLRRRWSRPVWYGPGRITECGGLICFPDGAHIEAVDPLTGEPVWRIAADLVVDFESYLVAFTVAGSAGGATGDDTAGNDDPPGTGAGRIVDPATGRTVLPLSAWETELEGRGDATFVGYRRPVEGGPTWLAVLAPSAESVRIVGSVTSALDGCVGNSDTIVCRDGTDSITIWHYQP
ncbi:PQQ-binding-like beta-propeller repeat protein [Solwaraspora sp. WMMB335]|uniref:outer membrane protein assembly factor BamB family protein n=1 Tax=Solwaraspora sp. WMMB335 TaxID=3404118 RepID=UPI003B950FFC